MRMSKLFSQTLRDAPAEAEIASHRLLLRAGYIRQLAAGVFSYLPLARKALNKIENILRSELNAIGGQEITMPVVHPAELWQETKRWYQIGDEMGRFQDRSGRDMVLAMTHEEVIGDLIRKEIHSYRQLPLLLYHIQTKWRDDPRPRAGLIRVREFTMKDSYSLDLDWEGLDIQYRAHYQAYFNIFHRCDLDVLAVKSDVGMMGGQLAHEFMYLSPVGEDTIMICETCGYSANRQIAKIKKITLQKEKTQPIKKVSTPNCKTIEELADFLGIPKTKTAKAVFIMATIPDDPGKGEISMEHEQFVFAIVRGDMELNETKLANALKARNLRPATEEEIRNTGAEPGYASPVDLKGILVVVDDLIPESQNLVAGANEYGYHLLNVNYGRDFTAEITTDIVAAKEGDLCPQCSSTLKAVRGVEVGNIFKLGTRYSEALDARYQDKDGNARPIVMGSYGIGSGRLLACIAEAHHDQNGLKLPISVAPYQVYLIVLVGKVKKYAGSDFPSQGAEALVVDQPESNQVAEELYMELQAAGIEVLYDDRDESPGVKFNDADLIGIPLRLTVSQRALSQGGIEFKRRDQNERRIIPVDQVIEVVKEEIKILGNLISQKVIPVEYVE